MPVATINDIELYYEEHGSGQPIVLIAGFSVDHTSWALVVGALAARYRVITFDNRGSGQSSVPDGPYTIKQMADDVAALCQHLSIEQTVCVGNSMGGVITQALCHQYPQLVTKAIICNSTTHMNCNWDWFIEAELALLEANAPIDAISKINITWCFSYGYLSQPGVMDAAMDLSLNNPYPFTLTAFKAQRAALTNIDTRPWLKHIKQPCLIITADEDILLPPRCSDEMASLITHATTHRFASCGHLPHIEQPEAFVAVVNEFIHQA